MVWGYVRFGDFSGKMKGFSWVIFILLKLKIFECLDKSYYSCDRIALICVKMNKNIKIIEKIYKLCSILMVIWVIFGHEKDSNSLKEVN